MFPFIRTDGQSVSHSIVNSSLECLTNGIQACHLIDGFNSQEPKLNPVNESPPLASTPKKPVAAPSSKSMQYLWIQHNEFAMPNAVFQ